MLFSKQTPASGGDAFAQFDAAWCYDGNGYILNDTGTSLDVRIGASGSVQTLAAGGTLPIKLVYSLAELYVRRTDQSTTQVTVEAQVGTGSAGGGTSAEVGVIAAATAAAVTAAHNADPAAHKAHTQAWSTITDTPTTLSGYGITDAAHETHTQAWSTITDTPTTLSGYGITDAQPLDSDLTAIAGLSTTGLVARTGAGTAATRTITGTSNQVIVSNGDGVAGNPTLALPQDVATTSTPQFARLGLGKAADGTKAIDAMQAIQSTVSGGSNSTNIYSYGGLAAVSLYSADGTSASPAPWKKGAELDKVLMYSYGQTTYGQAAAQITTYATEDHSDTAKGTRITFSGTPTGSTTISQWMSLKDGNVGIGSTSPAAQLHLRSGSTDIVEAIRLDNPTNYIDNGSKIVWRNADVSNDAAFFAARRIGATTGYALTFGTAAAWSTAAATEKMRIAGNGNVGINNTKPQRKLDVVGDDSGNGIRVTGTTGTTGALTAEGTSVTIQADSAAATHVLVDAGSSNASGYAVINGGSSGYVQLGTGGTPQLQVFASGAVKLNSYGAGTLQTDSSGNVTASSDASLKTVTGSFTRGLADVLKLTPRTYHWNEKSGMNTEDENVGFIAQEVLTSVPEAVGQYRTTEMEIDGKKTKKREKSELLTLSDRPIIAALVNAVKELKAENDTLSDRLSKLEGKK